MKTENLENSNIRHKCHKCNSTFSYLSGLNKHLRKHEEFDRKKCEKTKTNLVEVFECAVCGKYFKHKKNLSGHIFLKHFKLKIHRCPHCKGKFSTKSNLVQHVKATHETNKTLSAYKCVNCGCYFKRKQSLSAHLSKQCRKNKNGAEDNIHMEDISGQSSSTPVEQSTDVTSLSQKNIDVNWGINITKAEKVKVNGENNYKCNACGKLFTKFYSLNRHLAVHNVGKPYKCCSCDGTFKHLSELRKHLKSIHSLKCKSNNNIMMWNALNESNSDLFSIVTKEKSLKNNKKSKELDNEKIRSKKCDNNMSTSKTYGNENLVQLEHLSMPNLDDEEIIMVATDTAACLKSDNNTEEAEPCAEISHPLFKDALIGQTNAILIENIKKDTVTLETNGKLQTSSIDHLNYVSTDVAGDDYSLSSEWDIFNHGVLSSNDFEVKPLDMTKNCLVDADNASKATELRLNTEVSITSQTQSNNVTNSLDINCSTSSMINVSYDINDVSFETDKNAISFGSNDKSEENSTAEKYYSNLLENTDYESKSGADFANQTYNLQIPNSAINISNPIYSTIEYNIIESCTEQYPLHEHNISSRIIGTPEDTPSQNSSQEFNVPCVMDTVNLYDDFANLPKTYETDVSKSTCNINLLKELKNFTRESTQLKTSSKLQNEDKINENIKSTEQKESITVDAEIEKLVNSFMNKKYEVKCNNIKKLENKNFDSDILSSSINNTISAISENNNDATHIEIADCTNQTLMNSNESEELKLICPNLITLPEIKTSVTEFCNVAPKVVNSKVSKNENPTSENIQCWVCGLILKQASLLHHKCISTYRYKCPICDEEFTNYYAKKKHVLKHVKNGRGRV